MSTTEKTLEELANREYKWGFVTDIEQESLPPGLDENVVREISRRKREPEFLLDWRLKAFRAWQRMEEPRWPNVYYPRIDYASIVYYSAPKKGAVCSRSLAST